MFAETQTPSVTLREYRNAAVLSALFGRRAFRATNRMPAWCHKLATRDRGPALFLSAVGSSIMALHDFSVQIGGDDDDQQSIDLQLLN